MEKTKETGRTKEAEGTSVKALGNGVVRLLRADEIECRIASISEKGVSLLLYKDARVDQKILDETFGPFGWKRSHQCMDGKLYCTVEIRDRETGEWIAKQDVGTTGAAEKEKSQASDSFKRACFNWGIGRELYTAPFIWIPADKVRIEKREGRFSCKERFSVQFIAYSGSREIDTLFIQNEKGLSVYEFYAKKKQGEPENKPPRERKEAPIVSKEQMDTLEKELKRTGVTMEAVQDRYLIKNPSQMSETLYNQVMRALAKTKTAKAD